MGRRTRESFINYIPQNSNIILQYVLMIHKTYTSETTQYVYVYYIYFIWGLSSWIALKYDISRKIVGGYSPINKVEKSFWRKFYPLVSAGTGVHRGAHKVLNIKYKTVILSLLLPLAAKMWNGNCAYWAKLGLTLDGPHKYPTLAACYFAPHESQANHNDR